MASCALIGLLVVLPGCGPGSREPSPTALELSPCRIDGTIEAECGHLKVPENPNQPNDAQIPISVAVVRARSDDPAPDPLFYLAGWGSAAIQDDMSIAVPLLSDVNQERDLVFIDQRGTGGSNLLTCPVPSDEEVAQAGLDAYTDAARACAEEIGPNLRYYTSAVAVNDFDRVREALGYDTINIYGISYGVTTGQVYLLRHGSRIRSAVFDGGSLLDVHIFERAAVGAQRALEMLFARCDADAACNAAFPDVRDEFESIVTAIQQDPLQIPGRPDRLDPITFAAAVDDLIAYTPNKPLLPRLIHLVASGELATVAQMFPGAAAPTESLAYMALIQCSEPWASWRTTEVERLGAGTFLEPLLLRNAAVANAACRGLPLGEVPADLGERVRSDVPVLFLTGDEDPADPPANVANAERELPNSLTVVFTGAGHGQLHLSCGQDLLTEFVVRGSAVGLDASCAATAALLPFDTRS